MSRKRLYGARLTNQGLHSPTPIRLRYDHFSQTYIGLDGEVAFIGLGHNGGHDKIDGGWYAEFVSDDIEAVRTWLTGVKDALSLINKWSSVVPS